MHTSTAPSGTPPSAKRAVEEPLIAGDAHRLTSKGQRTLAECFRLFDIIHRLTANHAIISRITREVIEDFAADNVKYLELRTTPKTRAELGMTKRSYMEAVLAGIDQYHAAAAGAVAAPPTSPRSARHAQAAAAAGEGPEAAAMAAGGAPPPLASGQRRSRQPHEDSAERDGLVPVPPGDPAREASGPSEIVVRVLLSIDRREGAEAALETVHLAHELSGRGVVGVDLSGNPSVGHWETWLPALQWARNRGLKLALHCGEVPNPAEIAAMLAFHPERVGHCCCLEAPEWAVLLASGIPVEVCLTSNILTESVTSYSAHHFANLYRSGHALVLCTDDSGVFGTSLSQEYAHAAASFGLTKEDLKRLAWKSQEPVFADNRTRQLLHETFQKCLAAL